MASIPTKMMTIERYPTHRKAELVKEVNLLDASSQTPDKFNLAESTKLALSLPTAAANATPPTPTRTSTQVPTKTKANK